MATCKECLHEKACFKMLEAMGYKVSTDYKGNADRCDTYTPKSQYAEVKHGEWEKVIKLNVAVNPYQHTCGLCGKSYFDHRKFNYPYCPNCGADMRGLKCE